MGHHNLFLSILILIGVACFVVLLFKKLRLSPVLGYLVAGGIIGEYGLNIVQHSQLSFIAEFGIVFLLFAIGLELSFERLKSLRKYVFGLGTLQVLITGLIVAGATTMFTDNLEVAIVIGSGLALSSTAIVMQIVQETKAQSTQIGRVSLAILLLQDFAVVPLLIIVPMLAGRSDDTFAYSIGVAFIKAVCVLGAIFIVGRTVFRPLFRIISSDGRYVNNEIFIAFTLLIALSAAYATEYMGLSMALGAFVSGILVAETEFRVAAEESIHPFKGLFLGLFFMTIGMTIDVIDLWNNITSILIISAAVIFIKALVIIALCVMFSFNKSTSLNVGVLLAQGSEFAFIMFKLASDVNILDPALTKVLMSVVTLTMAITPLLYTFSRKAVMHLNLKQTHEKKRMELGSQDVGNHVIIGGFGSVGRTVAQMLEEKNIHYIALDIDQSIVKESYESRPVFRGDISQVDMLEAAGIDRASAFVITIDNDITIRKTVKNVAKYYKHIPVVVRMHNIKHAKSIIDLGAALVVPEDHETALQLGGAILHSMGLSLLEISNIKNEVRQAHYIRNSLVLNKDSQNNVGYEELESKNDTV